MVHKKNRCSGAFQSIRFFCIMVFVLVAYLNVGVAGNCCFVATTIDIAAYRCCGAQDLHSGVAVDLCRATAAEDIATHSNSMSANAVTDVDLRVAIDLCSGTQTTAEDIVNDLLGSCVGASVDDINLWVVAMVVTAVTVGCIAATAVDIVDAETALAVLFDIDNYGAANFAAGVVAAK